MVLVGMSTGLVNPEVTGWNHILTKNFFLLFSLFIISHSVFYCSLILVFVRMLTTFQLGQSEPQRLTLNYLMGNIYVIHIKDVTLNRLPKKIHKINKRLLI